MRLCSCNAVVIIANPADVDSHELHGNRILQPLLLLRKEKNLAIVATGCIHGNVEEIAQLRLRAGHSFESIRCCELALTPLVIEVVGEFLAQCFFLSRSQPLLHYLHLEFLANRALGKALSLSRTKNMGGVRSPCFDKV